MSNVLAVEVDGPLSVIERELAALVAEVLELKLDRSGLHETFFEPGGRSVHVMRLHGALRQRYGLDLPVVELFRSPTVAFLASLLAPHLASGERRARSPGAVRRGRCGTTTGSGETSTSAATAYERER